MNRLDNLVKKTIFKFEASAVVLRCLLVAVLIILSAKIVLSQSGATIGRRYADLPQPPAQKKASSGTTFSGSKSPLPSYQPQPPGESLPPAPTNFIPSPTQIDKPISGSGAPEAKRSLPTPSALSTNPSIGTPSNPVRSPVYPTVTPAPPAITPAPPASVPSNVAAEPEEPDVDPPIIGQLVSHSQNELPTIPVTESVAFEPAKLVAVVGTDRILAGDMYTYVEPIIEQNRDKFRSKEQENAVRTQLTRQVLKQYVEVKALYQEFFRDASGSGPPGEVETMKKTVVTKAGKIFYEKQVPNLLKKYEVSNVAELEDKLREKSMSLLSLRTQFIEQVLSNELEHKYVPDEFEISSEEILEYYVAHRSDWEIPSRVRWRQLTIRFDKHPDRVAAEQLIKSLGNQIFLGGKSFEAVAKQSSEGFTAQDGGVYDWTNLGSLKSKVLEQAIFTLPIQRLSQVIEDDVGFHIVEVLEREEARTRDMASSQAEIRVKLSDEKRSQAAKEFREKIMKRTPIWTLWPEDIPGSRPLSQALGETASP